MITRCQAIIRKAFKQTIINANWTDAGKRKYTVDFATLKAKMLDSGS